MTLDTEAILTEIVRYIPKVIAAVVIFVLSLLASGWAAAWCKRSLAPRIEQIKSVELVALLLRWSILILGTIAALEQVNFDVSAFLTGLGVIGLTVGFALQDIAKNFMAGILILIRRPFEIGQAVSVAGYSGVILDVHTRDTTIRTWDGVHVILPNIKILEEPITNFSAAVRRRRTIMVGVAMDQDLSRAQEVFTQALGQVEGVLGDPAPTGHAETYGDSTITLALRFWLDPNSTNLLDVHSAAIAAVQRAAAEHSIVLPYPIQIVQVDTLAS